MRHAVRAEPDVISPNVLEAEELVGHEFNDDEDRAHRGRRDGRARRPRGDHDAARRLRRLRRRTTAGSKRYRVSIDPREAVAAVGAGDAFLAGYVAARYPGQPPTECLRLRRRLRRRVDPAPRRRPDRRPRGRAAARRGRGAALRRLPKWLTRRAPPCPTDGPLLARRSVNGCRHITLHDLSWTPPARGLFVRPRT